MAQIYFGLTDPSFAQGSVFEVGVFLDTQGQETAAVESVISMSPGLEILDIRDGNSVLNLWLERPARIDQSVAFSGITPGGFVGDRGELFRLVLKANDVGIMEINAEQTRVLLNNGEGTETEVIPAPINFTVTAEGEAATYEAPTDTERPEPFTPLLVEQTDLGGWVIVFAAQDKSSGIDHYEVREGWLNWRQATSPYLLEDQKLKHRISVKAVDRAGNIRVANVSTGQEQAAYLSWLLWGILGLVVVGFVGGWFMRQLWRKSYPRRSRR